MVTFTQTSGTQIHVNPCSIVSVTTSSGWTELYLVGGRIVYIKESPDYVRDEQEKAVSPSNPSS